MHLYRQRKLNAGLGFIEVPWVQGMPATTYIRWMLLFSTPFLVLSGFVLYRLITRLESMRRQV